MKTFMATKEKVHEQGLRKWWVVSGNGHVVGRLAARLAVMLQGKHKAIYTPHVDTGDFVVVTDVEKLRFTGRKPETKTYKHYTGHPGGLREIPYKVMREKKPEEILRLAVRRMLPKSRLGRQMLSKLKIYKGSEHPHAAQRPEPLKD